MIKTLFSTPALWILRWFDNSLISTDDLVPGTEKRIDFARVIPFIAVHLACLLVLWVGFSWIALAVCLSLYALRMFAITAFYHRYFSHRSFKTSRLAQFIFAFVGNTSAQRGPLWWAAHHRAHHRHSDKECDVHSPDQHGFLWSHMFWITSRHNFATRLDKVKDLARYPELRFLDRFDVVAPLLLGGFTFSLGMGLNYFFPSLGTGGMQMMIWGFFVSTVLVFHATCTINSLAHQIGRQRYETGDQSRNSLLLALLTFGEGWHNNHHYYPASVRQGFFWYEIDITYYLLRLLSCFGIIWDLKPVPEKVKLKGVSHEHGQLATSRGNLSAKLQQAES